MNIFILYEMKISKWRRPLCLQPHPLARRNDLITPPPSGPEQWGGGGGLPAGGGSHGATFMIYRGWYIGCRLCRMPPLRSIMVHWSWRVRGERERRDDRAELYRHLWELCTQPAMMYVMHYIQRTVVKSMCTAQMLECIQSPKNAMLTSPD